MSETFKSIPASHKALKNKLKSLKALFDNVFT